MQAPLEFDLGRRVSRDRPLGDTLPQGLRYVFAGKAAETLHGRANPFLRFIKWCRDAGEEAFPLCEPLVFRFCTEMEGGCSAPTFLHSFLTTLRFAHYILGLSNALECATSPRVAGVARLMYLSKRKKRQRPPLTAEMVVALEKLTCNAEAPALDRVIAGFFVLLVFSRGRFSDGLNMQNLRSVLPGLCFCRQPCRVCRSRCGEDQGGVYARAQDDVLAHRRAPKWALGSRLVRGICRC